MKLSGNKIKVLISIAVVVVVIISAIGYAEYVKPSQASGSGKITVTDILGQKFTFNSTLTRIVSLDPSATAVLYALGACSHGLI